ncbi:VWA domain-containing protein [Luteimonas aestuarii]|uniref:VWA domain-containing protein n=1 Tax=Luteimonas aestuarii TaxID=453837 RepID=A0A4R5TL25_9GAMM|nr:VWA domain-containing protein [Luteimonas aestuarii]TDK23270.1 VWA domain-containing protein [Luteimonas aestuarii]
MTDWIASLLPAGFAGFAWPWLLLALPLPLLVRWLAPPVRSGATALKVPWAGRLDGIAAGGDGMRRVRAMPLLAWAGWALLCIAAARPQGFGEVMQPPQAGRDLMLAVDLSGSMAEEDMRLGGRVVDRLTAAKAVLADFLDRREGDRVGLIVFGGRAYALAPLTLDRDTVRDQLLDSSVGLAGRETAIGDAIGLAVKRLRAQDAQQRVLVLLTDGVSNAGLLDPDRAARIARDEGVRIHTIAFGGDVQPLSMFGFRLPRAGADLEIDEAALARIAGATGGRAFHARDAEELGGIYAEIDRLEPVQRAGPGVRPLLELYRWPLALALLCGALALWPLRLRWPARVREMQP